MINCRLADVRFCIASEPACGHRQCKTTQMVALTRDISYVLLFGVVQGSGVIKAGFAGDQTPKCRFPNLYALFLNSYFVYNQ